MGKLAQDTKLFKPRFNQIKYDQFLQVISDIYSLLSLKLKDSVSLSSVLENKATLKSNLKTDFIGKPEFFTRENVIDLLLNCLGYTLTHRAGESDLKQIFGSKYPDYKLITSPDLTILVEAEPLNEDIYNKPNAGLNQVYVWLESKRSRTDYGIATNGFEWVLVQYLVEANKKIEIKKVDLTPFFLKLSGRQVSDPTLKEIFLDFFSYFSLENTEAAISGFVKIQNDTREDISKKFYERYLETIFGVNREGKKINDNSLFDAIQNVPNSEERKKIAQLTVNRLIFIKFIESKGWINNNPRFLKDLKDQYAKNPTPAGFFKTFLEPLFFLALNNPSTNKPHPYENVRYLNGGLFRKDKIEEANATYDISNDKLLRIIDFLEDYDFKIKGSADHEGKETLDPEILGYIFERTANHEAGAFYTPEIITTHIANQTIESLVMERINAYLREKGEKEKSDLYSIFGENGLDIDHLRNLYEKRQVLNIKILDPACGSGAFFIPVIRKLMDLHRRFYKEINRVEPNQYQLQKRIVEDNIYGVDINEEAIEIAKLRLWLDLLDSVENISDVDALPNIEYNVMAGNSLIGADEIPEMARADFYTYYHPTRFEQIIQVYPDLKVEADALIGKSAQFNMTFKDLFLLRNKLITKYRSETHPVYASRLRDIIEQISEKFRFELSRVYFHKALGIEKTEDLNSAITQFKPFNWIMEFSDVFEKGGFDAVIGNPPYIRIQDLKRMSLKQVDIFSNTYETAKSGNYDIYVIFVEKGLKLLSSSGNLGYILPHKFFQAEYGESLREFISKRRLLKEVINFTDQQIFGDATTYTCLLFLDNKGSNHFKYAEIYDASKLFTLLTIVQTNNAYLTTELKISTFSFDSVSSSPWNLSFGKEAEIMKKLNSVKTNLGDFSENLFQGIITGADKIFMLVKKDCVYYSNQTKKTHLLENDLLHPLLKGSKHVRRYYLESSDKYVIFPYVVSNGKATALTESELKSKYPRTYEYLLENKPVLEKRDSGKMTGGSWYLFSRNQSLARFGQDKIITPSIARKSSFVYDTNNDFFFVGSGGGGGGAYGITLKDKGLYWYVLSILNSKLISFFMLQTSSRFSGGYFAFNRQYIDPIPIILAAEPLRKKLENLAKIQQKELATIASNNEKSPGEIHNLEKIIEKTDLEIDRLVYELYGLTEEEMKIVEGAVK